MSSKKKPKTATKTAPGAARKKAAPKPAQKAAKKAAKKSATKPAPRADFGAPIDDFFGKQPAQTRPILEELRKLVEAAAPDAHSSLKWGMPTYAIGGKMMCALAGHKAHVNLVLSGPPGSYADPDGLLTGEGKSGRHIRLTSLAELPRAQVRGWLKTAAAVARKA
ncbi:MAG TPA: DUF1801 domain-containing protein [Polyangiaceae bacterium]|jgi:hypothetical protein|nr:DUF1801 domain-containing protein [Polyangiaceae bacterium]